MQTQIGVQDRNWAMAAHLSALVALAGLPFGHVLGPLIVYLVRAHDSEFVAEHARASLNYQITVSIVGLIGIIVFVGAALIKIVTSPLHHAHQSAHGATIVIWWLSLIVASLLVLLVSLAFIIAGTLAASAGRPYTYPLAIRFLR
jgi:uncharacterized protein